MPAKIKDVCKKLTTLIESAVPGLIVDDLYRGSAGAQWEGDAYLNGCYSKPIMLYSYDKMSDAVLLGFKVKHHSPQCIEIHANH